MESPWVTVAAVVIATIACAVAGYMIGHRQDSDPAPAPTAEPARANAGAADDPAGAPEGSPAAQDGYDKAFAQARKDEYAKAFARAYREAYINVFEASGLKPPKDVTVPEATGG